MERFSIKVQKEGTLVGVSGVFIGDPYPDLEQQALQVLWNMMLHAKKSGSHFRIFGLPDYKEKLNNMYRIFIQTAEHDFWVQGMQELGLGSISETLIHEGKYAVLKAPFRGKDMDGLWNYFYNQWLAESLFHPIQNQFLEEFVIGKSTESIKDVKLYIKIDKKDCRVTIVCLPEKRFVVYGETGEDAEETVSRKLMDKVLKYQWPVKSLYVSCYQDQYICGMNIVSDMEVPDYLEPCTVIVKPSGLYATIEAKSYGDYTGLLAIAHHWLDNNSNDYQVIGESFAIFSLDDAYEVQTMRIYIPVDKIIVINEQKKI